MKKKYKFYLNKNDFYKWTRCLNCEGKTKVRKFNLLINSESLKEENNEIYIAIKQSCKYCPYCDLIIAQDRELREELIGMASKHENVLLNYKVIGTIERKHLKDINGEELPKKEKRKLIKPFKKILEFEIQRAGWYFEGN